MKPHKHAELIKAWADGAEIEMKVSEWHWVYIHKPHWDDDVEYRIKPEQNVDEVSYLIWGEALLGWCEFLRGTFVDHAKEKIKVIRDGKTGKIKGVELMQ